MRMHGKNLGTLATLALGFAAVSALALSACDSEREDPYALPKKSKSLGELKQSVKSSPEEIAEARKKAGFKDPEEIAKENAAMFEKGAREYVKTRMKEYQAFMKEFRGYLDDIEKQAPKWAAAKDPAKAFGKWETKHKEATKKFTKTYDELTGRGAEGGNTQAVLGRAFRSWEDLDGALGPELANNERFAATLEEIRKDLDEVDKALADIDKDEALLVNETYEGKKKGKDAAEDAGDEEPAE